MASLQEAVQIYEEIEIELLQNVAKQFPNDLEVDNPDEWLTNMLIAGAAVRAVNMRISNKKRSTAERLINSYFNNEVYTTLDRSERNFTTAAQRGILTARPPALRNSVPLNAIFDQRLSDTQAVLNLTRTTALEASNQAYLNIVNRSYLEMTSGVSSYQTATRNAVTRLARAGITGQTYNTPRGTIRYSVDTAVRRQLLTSTAQTAGEMVLQRNAEWGNNFVEVSSHFGARPDHGDWQGQVYAIEGSTAEFANLVESTGYGTVTGLLGANCGHNMSEFVPGVNERRFFPYDKAENDAQYEKFQGQRRRERSIREEKKSLIAAESANDKKSFQKHSKLLKKKERALRDFKAENGLTQQSRIQVVGFNRSISQKAVNAAKAG